MTVAPDIVRELRYRPRIAAELLRDLLRVSLPAFDGVRSERLDGAAPADDAAPFVVVLSHARSAVFAIVVDAPADCDSALRVQWPEWTASVSARLSTPAAMLVVTVDPVVERWALQPIHLPDREPFRPHVVGPASIPSDGQNTPMLVLMALGARITQQA